MYMLKLLNSSLVTTYRILCSRSAVSKSDIVTVLSAMPKKLGGARVNFCTKSTVSLSYCYAEVIGSGAEGAPASVWLNTNIYSYLLNCGEGTMKLASEYKIKLHKSANVFITYPSWKNLSGLAGLALSVQNSGGTEMCIHSDSSVENIFSSINKFAHLRHLQVKVQHCLQSKGYSDDYVSVKYVFLYPSSRGQGHLSDSSLENESDSCDSDSERYTSAMAGLFKKNEREKSPCPKTEKRKESQCEHRNSKRKARKCMNYAISYIFSTAGTMGTLSVEKCMEYGVPPGPLLGKLKQGIDVTLSDGKIVRSCDVKGPDLPGVNVIALECPSEDYLDSLLEEPAFYQYQTGETPAETVIHFTSAGITKNAKYQEWISRFPKSTLHLFINEENKGSGSVGIHRQQYKLNLLQPELFPLLDDSGIPEYPRTDPSDIPSGHTIITENLPQSTCISISRNPIFLKCETNNFIRGETLMQLNLNRRHHFNYSRSMVLNKEEFFNEMFENDVIKEKIEEGQRAVKAVEETVKSDDRIYPKIVFLGTGSSKPSKVRNGSGILIFVDSSRCILLDCGEYTYGQMFNFYGKKRAREILRSLQAIYVSHMHLDHHMGLITLLKERKLAFDELGGAPSQSVSADASLGNAKFSPVFVLGPVQLLRWLNTFSEQFEDISHLYLLIPNSDILNNSKKSNDKIHACKKNLSLKSLLTVPVAHCANSFGVSLIHNEGWKITYSGDTRPCKALIDLGMNSDVLIHEATLEDAYAEEAKSKLHSTTSEAIGVGKQMKAKHILLTHFSQRYCHLPNVDSFLSDCNVGIAFDFMEVPFNKLPLLPALIEPMRYTFSKYDEINKSTTEMFLIKKARKRSRFDLKDVIDLMETPAKVLKNNY